jgi:DNA repair exonuclease SbcCD nuclease subunit
VTRFLCIGDLHLGAGADYGREPGDRLKDQEAVWARALELAADHDVDAVLFAGDAFHRRRPTPAELIAFQRPLQAFTADHDIEVVAINGNHDYEATNLPTALDVFGREVDLFTQPGVWLAEGGCAVACLPWAPVSRLLAARGGGDRDGVNDEAAALLVVAARGLRGQVDGPAVLMLHFSISGASTPTGVMTDEFREVVLPIDELEALGFDAVVAGHIHLPDVINGPFDGGRPIFYVGSPAPVDFGEASSPHGCFLLEVGEGGTRTTFLPIESRPFVTIDVDGIAVAGPAPEMALFSHEDEVADAVVRVRYTATEEQARRIDHSLISRDLYRAGVHKVFAIQPTILRAERARVAGVDEDLGPREALGLWVAANDDDVGEHAGALVDLTNRYLEAVTA